MFKEFQRGDLQMIYEDDIPKELKVVKKTHSAGGVDTQYIIKYDDRFYLANCRRSCGFSHHPFIVYCIEMSQVRTEEVNYFPMGRISNG